MTAVFALPVDRISGLTGRVLFAGLAAPAQNVPAFDWLIRQPRLESLGRVRPRDGAGARLAPGRGPQVLNRIVDELDDIFAAVGEGIGVLHSHLVIVGGPEKTGGEVVVSVRGVG